MFFIKSFIKSVWRVHKQKTQSYRESCVLHFGHFELYKFEYISLWSSTNKITKLLNVCTVATPTLF